MTINISNLQKSSEEIKEEMFSLMQELFPICRSITGNGVRKTLERIKKDIPLSKFEIPTGTQVFDWIIPKEWNIVDAYVSDLSGKKIIDFQKSNLHVVNYSIPIKKQISLNELKKHIFSNPEKPNYIPYVTSYYNETWGFCLEHNELIKMKDKKYDVIIESKLEDGFLTYGEFFIKGESENEILISTYICHPSMCNDNLSGVVVATALAKYLKNLKLKYSIRFLFIPETIGAISWLYLNQNKIKNIKHGLVLTCLGDSGHFTYKKSRRGDAEIDETVVKILKESKKKFEVVEFFPWGSDERQFCSPGFNLPVGSLIRTMYDKFPEYHTSGDNLDFMNKNSLKESFEKYFLIISELEKNFGIKKIHVNEKREKIRSDKESYFLTTNPKCEPQLGKYNVYKNFGGQYEESQKERKLAIFWILNYSDGVHSLEDIARKSKLDLDLIKKISSLLESKKLILRN
jgi:aminopeptidase-like protein